MLTSTRVRIPLSALCDLRSLAGLVSRSKTQIADAAYFAIEIFIVINTVHTIFFQPPGDSDIAYWFRRQWVVLPGYLQHYKRPILLLHFLSGMVSLFGMRCQCGNRQQPSSADGGGAGPSRSSSSAHRKLGYVVLVNQVFVHSPTILMMNAFVVDYHWSRTAFYCMTFTATVKCAVKAVCSARRGDVRAHRRAARTLYNYISTFTKGRVYMYLVLPVVPDSWRVHHIFISDIVSVAVAARYSWARTLKLFAVFAIYGLLIEALPWAWSALTISGVFYTAVYA